MKLRPKQSAETPDRNVVFSFWTPEGAKQNASCVYSLKLLILLAVIDYFHSHTCVKDVCDFIFLSLVLWVLTMSVSLCSGDGGRERQRGRDGFQTRHRHQTFPRIQEVRNLFDSSKESHRRDAGRSLTSCCSCLAVRSWGWTSTSRWRRSRNRSRRRLTRTSRRTESSSSRCVWTPHLRSLSLFVCLFVGFYRYIREFWLSGFVQSLESFENAQYEPFCDTHSKI